MKKVAESLRIVDEETRQYVRRSKIDALEEDNLFSKNAKYEFILLVYELDM